MKNKSSFIFIFLVIFIAVLFIYTQKPHRNIGNEKADYEIESKMFLNEFRTNETNASSKFLDQTIIVSGKVTEININFLTLDDKIYCKFVSDIPTSILNTNLNVKGRCIGYDELLGQVKLDQCSFKK